MPTEFLDILEKAFLMSQIAQGNIKAGQRLLSEIDRLESRIRDYEVGMQGVVQKLESNTFKKPAI